jgi:8-oxo-dGTP pyrophosphatase MutT (NUDIX family)
LWSTSSERTGSSSSNTRIIPTRGAQVPAGGVHPGEAPIEAAIREVREETGVHLESEPTFVGAHEHLDGLGNAARSHFFRVDAPDGLPKASTRLLMLKEDGSVLIHADSGGFKPLKGT